MGARFVSVLKKHGIRFPILIERFVIMKKIRMNSTNLDVSPLCFGQIKIGIANVSEELAGRLLDIFLDLGGNFIDTARAYSEWVPGEKNRSERILGDYFKRTGKRDQFVICSKCCHYDMKTMEQRVGAKFFMEDLDGSLKSLQTDCIDLYLFHRDNPEVPIAELMEACEAARKQGKIKYYGSSNWSIARMMEAGKYAAEHGFTGFVADQMTVNPGIGAMNPPRDKTITLWNKDFADYHRKSGVTVMSCSSMAHGVFSAYNNPETWERIRKFVETPEFPKAAERMNRLAAETGLTQSQLCLRYTADYPGIQGIPLFTASSEEHLRECMGCFDRDLPQDVFDRP